MKSSRLLRSKNFLILRLSDIPQVCTCASHSQSRLILEPDILILDEVPAVGDTRFQEKCIGRMKDIATGGRTVLVVSHNLAAVNHMADRTVLLESGQIAASGSVGDVVSIYLSKSGRQSSYVRDERDRP